MRIQSHYIEEVYPHKMAKNFNNWIRENDDKIVRIIAVNNWYDNKHSVNCCSITYTERDY